MHILEGQGKVFSPDLEQRLHGKIASPSDIGKFLQSCTTTHYYLQSDMQIIFLLFPEETGVEFKAIL